MSDQWLTGSYQFSVPGQCAGARRVPATENCEPRTVNCLSVLAIYQDLVVRVVSALDHEAAELDRHILLT
jgi:hypothetical protein